MLCPLNHFALLLLFSCQIVSDLRDPMDCSPPGFPVPNSLLDFAQDFPLYHSPPGLECTLHEDRVSAHLFHSSASTSF